MKKGIYLASGNAYHPNHNIIYQDINMRRDLNGDMLEIDLTEYDYIIATPPCNYWSRARGKRLSQYSKDTKHLLPSIINKCLKLNKPFIIENVKNNKRFLEEGLFNNQCIIKIYGRHTYWTNVQFNLKDIPQRQDFKQGGYVIKYDDMKTLEHQGGYNVHNVIEEFLKIVDNDNFNVLQLCQTM